MFLEKVQKKFTLKLQIIVCMILIVLSVFFSFMPLATINLKSSEEKISFQRTLVSTIGDDSVDIGDLPDQVNIPTFKMLESIPLISDIRLNKKSYYTTFDNRYVTEHTRVAILNDLIEEANGNLSPEQKEKIIIAIIMVSSFDMIDNFFGNELTTTNHNSYSEYLPFHITILSLVTILSGICFIVITVLLPLIYIIILIKSVVNLLKHKSRLPEYVPVISGRLPKAAIFPLFYIIIPFLIQGLSFGIGGLFLLLITLLCSVVSAFLGRVDFIGRLKDDNNKNKNIMNVNILQGISIIVFVGYLVFLFSFLQTDLVQTFFKENYFGYLQRVIYAEHNGMHNIEASHLFYLNGLLMVAMVIILLVVVPIYFTKNLRRFSFTSSNDRHIVLSSLMALLVILPLICAKTELGYLNLKDVDNGTFSLLPLTSAQLTNLIISLAGIVIVLAAEIALIILKKKYVWEDLQVVKQTNSAKKSPYSNTLSEYYMKNHTNSKEANKSDTKHI